MRKLTVDDIKDLREYERERPEFRGRIIDMKKRRRVPLGDILTLTFENTDTMRYQVQEMARAERMLSDEQIAHEVATYNELVPDDGELSGTLFVEITKKDGLYEWLPRLAGIQRSVALWVNGTEIRAVPADEERLTREDTTTTVHYLKFPVSSDERDALLEGPAHVIVDHPNYQTDIELTPEQREELARDLAG